MRRYTCIICNKKRYEHRMINVFKAKWVCKFTDCIQHEDIKIIKEIYTLQDKLKILTSIP